MLQVLIIEEHWLIADVLRGDLEALGCKVLGPALGCRDGLDILAHHKVDMSFVATHVDGGNCEDVLEQCEKQRTTVVIFTGHLDGGLPEFARGRKVLSKPHPRTALEEVVSGFEAGAIGSSPQ